MPRSPVNGERPGEALPHRIGWNSADAHPLLPPARSGLELQISRPDAQHAGEEAAELPVRRALERPGRDPNAERVAVEPGHTRSRRSRDNVHAQPRAVGRRPEPGRGISQ